MFPLNAVPRPSLYENILLQVILERKKISPSLALWEQFDQGREFVFGHSYIGNRLGLWRRLRHQHRQNDEADALLIINPQVRSDGSTLYEIEGGDASFHSLSDAVIWVYENAHEYGADYEKTMAGAERLRLLVAKIEDGLRNGTFRIDNHIVEQKLPSTDHLDIYCQAYALWSPDIQPSHLNRPISPGHIHYFVKSEKRHIVVARTFGSRPGYKANLTPQAKTSKTIYEPCLQRMHRRILRWLAKQDIFESGHEAMEFHAFVLEQCRDGPDFEALLSRE